MTDTNISTEVKPVEIDPATGLPVVKTEGAEVSVFVQTPEIVGDKPAE